MNNLIGPDDMRRRNTGPGGADIEGLGEFDELGARDVSATNENGNLQTNAGRAPGSGRSDALPFLKNVNLHEISLGTKDLVRI